MATKTLERIPRGDLAKYDPEKGLKIIAVAEAAEKHFARAKDASQLQMAIRAKLTAQAEFVFWWDTQAEKSKGAATKRPNRSVRALTLGRDGLPDPMVVSRWRAKLSEPEAFEATYAQALARYLKILELDPSVHVSQNSGENEWYTPADIIEAARTVLGGIDLDPASSAAANRLVKADRYFSIKDSGLEQIWYGRVWMNPPYAQPLVTQFAATLATYVKAGTVTAAVVLVNNATETEWFNTIVDVSVAVCFPRGRVRFWSPDKDSATPLQGQAILYAGDRLQAFQQAFISFGVVLVKPDANGK